MSVQIRLARMEDLDRLMEIFDHARSFMKATGNPSQWINGYPQREMIAGEIAANHCYVCCKEEGGEVVGTFAFVPSPDPNYARIESGNWLNDASYYVIHRLASDGSCRGIGKACIEWCWEQCHSLRADTHHDNKIMQKLLENNGFVRCGIIYVANGTPRIAYQRI